MFIGAVQHFYIEKMPKLLTKTVPVIISMLQVRKQKHTKVLRLAGKAHVQHGGAQD